jgi:hypothetical protein
MSFYCIAPKIERRHGVQRVLPTIIPGQERREHMIKNALDDNEKEQRHHRLAVENVAQDLQRSKESVITLYEILLTRYKRKARIKDFITPLVIKRVKELLRDDKQPSTIEGRRNRTSEL